MSNETFKVEYTYSTFFRIVLLLLLFCQVTLAEKKFKPIDYMVLSTSIWYSLSDTDKDSYFNTLQFLYYKGITKNCYVHFSLPLTLSKEKKIHSEKRRFAPGDLHLYVGYKTKYLEPRLGCYFPLGYGQDITESWIGSNNIKLYAGLGHKAFLKNQLIELTGETGFSYFINDALYGKKSLNLSHFSKGSVKIRYRFKSGLELYGFYNQYTKESWQNSNATKISFGLVPTTFLSFIPNWRYEFTARGGYGFSRYGLQEKGSKRTGYNIINAAIAMGVAF